MKPTINEQKLRQLRDFLGALPIEYQPKFIHGEDLTAAAESLRNYKELVEMLEEIRRSLCPMDSVDDLTDPDVLRFYKDVHKIIIEDIDNLLTKIKQSAQ